MNVISEVRPYLEIVYFIASIGLFASVIIGLYQLKFLKADIRIKNKRASMEKSLEYLDFFSSDFFPQLSKYRERLEEVKKIMVEGVPVKLKETILGELKYEKVRIDVNTDMFQKNDRECKKYLGKIAWMTSARAVSLLNQLEYFSAAMTCGLADEELAYNPLSEAYCDIIEEHYYVLCYLRKDNPKLYSNVIKLYKIWKSRINKEDIQGKKKELDDMLSQITDTKIKPINL